MTGLFTWCQWSFASCLLGAMLLPTPAEAAQGEPTTFAETALVTYWSLEKPAGAFASLSGPNVAQAMDQRSVLVTPPVSVHVPSTATSAARLAGPKLADEDLEARGYVQTERKQPYRMPRDIKRLQIAFQVLNAVDAATTLTCLKQDDCHENNPIYGKHPKPIVVIGAKTLVGAVHYYAIRSLAQDYPGLARALGWVTITIQGGVVGLNLSRLL